MSINVVRSVLRVNQQVFDLIWGLRRKLRLSPTQQLFRELERRGVKLGELSALEVFGGNGDMHTKDYAARVASLEVWEVDTAKEQRLRRNLPMAELKITDAFTEIKTVSGRYDLIVIDNPEKMYGNHAEHFEIFPEVFRVALDSSVIITTVIPGFSDPDGENRSRLFSEAHLARRRAFYQTSRPEKVSFGEMIAAYQSRINDQGFDLEWHFFRQRTLDARLHYLVLKIKRRAPSEGRAGAGAGEGTGS